MKLTSYEIYNKCNVTQLSYDDGWKSFILFLQEKFFVLWKKKIANFSANGRRWKKWQRKSQKLRAQYIYIVVCKIHKWEVRLKYEATYHSFPGPHSIFKSLFICIRILSGLDSLFTFTIRWYGSNLVSRQKVSRYTNTTNTSCRYTYKDLDCRHKNTLVTIMVCTYLSKLCF